MAPADRRGFLRGLAALPVVGTPVRAAESPDAPLLALGARFNASWQAEKDLGKEMDWSAPESEWDRYDQLLDAAALQTKAIAEQIDVRRALSLDGLLVKIRVASWCHSGEPIDEEWLACAGFVADDAQTSDIRIVMSILRDLAAIGGCGVPQLAESRREVA